MDACPHSPTPAGQAAHPRGSTAPAATPTAGHELPLGAEPWADPSLLSPEQRLAAFGNLVFRAVQRRHRRPARETNIQIAKTQRKGPMPHRH